MKAKAVKKGKETKSFEEEFAECCALGRLALED